MVCFRFFRYVLCHARLMMWLFYLIIRESKIVKLSKQHLYQPETPYQVRINYEAADLAQKGGFRESKIALEDQKSQYLKKRSTKFKTCELKTLKEGLNVYKIPCHIGLSFYTVTSFANGPINDVTVLGGIRDLVTKVLKPNFYKA